MKLKKLIFLLGLLLFSLLSYSFLQNEITDELLIDEKNSISVYNKAIQSVVNVTNIQLAKTWAYGTVEVPRGAGSGFLWDSEGHIVTNYHVVQGGDNFLISFHKDSKQYRAKLVGVAVRKDIAVLKLLDKPATLNPVTVSTSKNLLVGQKVIAIGNPFGLDHTMTTGIVSALERKIEGVGGVKIYGMIQTDASINPGNSGGPLLNSMSRLIGMNTMIFSKSGTSSGVGFAVPADTITSIVPQLIKHGKVIRPALGVGILPDHVKVNLGVKKGLVITDMVDGGPADKAGMQGMGQDRYGQYYLGDIILAIDDQETNNFDDIYNILDKYKIGDTVQVTIQRKEKISKVKIQLVSASE